MCKSVTKTKLTRNFIIVDTLTQIHGGKLHWPIIGRFLPTPLFRHWLVLHLSVQIRLRLSFLQMLLIVQSHRRILHKRIIATTPRAMEVSVHFVARAIWKTTVHVTVVELETVEYVYVVVEVLAVHYQHVFFVSDVKASVLVAMVMDVAQIWAKSVWAFGVLGVDVEALEAVVLDLKQEGGVK